MAEQTGEHSAAMAEDRLAEVVLLEAVLGKRDPGLPALCRVLFTKILKHKMFFLWRMPQLGPGFFLAT